MNSLVGCKDGMGKKPWKNLHWWCRYFASEPEDDMKAFDVAEACSLPKDQFPNWQRLEVRGYTFSTRLGSYESDEKNEKGGATNEKEKQLEFLFFFFN